jgi:8-oxo-dGTP pyrophosphatase MutT (NUDIX family)
VTKQKSALNSQSIRLGLGTVESTGSQFLTRYLGENASSMNKLPAAWLAELLTSIQQPPLTPRVPLRWAGHSVGSVDAQGFEAFVAQAGVSNVVRFESESLPAWQLLGDPSVALQFLANTMRQCGYAQVARLWRNEQLAIRSASGAQLATVERGAVRALGISTHGVHLHGYTAANSTWIQQRALDKKTDPGLWDTLMGGTVSAGDSLARALERESMEEAGLRLDQVQDLRPMGSFTMRLPNAHGTGLEYVVERIDWYECLVPDDVIPVNTDGEVQQFNLVSQEKLCRMLLGGLFTTEAAMILGQWMINHSLSKVKTQNE